MSKENRNQVITHVVAITGSMRFYEKMQAIAKVYTKAGRLVLMPVKIRSDEKKQPLDEDTKKMLLQMQHERILMADELCVINVDGYIGHGTQEAIDFAKSHHVPITYLSPVPFDHQPQTITLCGSRKFLDTFKKIYKAYTLNRGWIVHMPAIFSVDNPEDLSKEQLEYLDLLHQEKMKESDWVYIINRGGYIGDDTRKEIKFCQENGIPLKFYEIQDLYVTSQEDVGSEGEKTCDRPIDWEGLRDIPILSTAEGIIPKIDWDDLSKIADKIEKECLENSAEPETTDKPEADQKELRAEFAKADDDALKEFHENFDKLTNGNADQGDVGTECDPAKFIDPDGARNATVVKTLSREGRYDIKPGDKVVITEGAFQGLTGTYIGTYPYDPDAKSLKDCDPGYYKGIITVSMSDTDMPEGFQVALDVDQFIRVRDPKEITLQAIAYTNMKATIAGQIYDPGKKLAEQFANRLKDG